MADFRDIAREIELLMVPCLDNQQLGRLRKVLEHCMFEIDPSLFLDNVQTNEELLEQFISSKRLEGCSERSIKYYESTIRILLRSKDIPVQAMSTENIRDYLSSIQKRGSASQITVDNIRRIISSFFSWLECEDYIAKSPVRRIKKLRVAQTVKETYSDETLEVLRDGCSNNRDLALVDMLTSTGMRVGELVTLDVKAVDLINRECIVQGKGNKERKVYFDARTKVHLQAYLAGRDDKNPALFVSLAKPHARLQISGVECRLRLLGKTLVDTRVHPHKFRRTLATKAIDKGMPIEQVQVLLGHKKIDTTLRYAMVDQRNVKASHQRYIG